MKASYRVLEAGTAPRHKDLALGLMYRAGLTTVLSKRTRRGLILEASLADGDADAPARLRAAERLVPGGVFRSIRVKRIVRGPWADKYQKFLKPFALLPPGTKVPALRIDPRGEGKRGAAKDGTLFIKASLAFGTGTHATTRLAAEMLGRCLQERGTVRVLDVGCGTGILAMAAARWGARGLVAVDNDPEALETARANLAANGIRGVVLRADLPAGGKRFDLVVANITADVLATLRDALLGRLKKGGKLILSGLLYRDVAGVLRRYGQLKLLERRNRNGWAALLFQAGARR